MKELVLDAFEDISGWTAIAPGQVRLQLSRKTGQESRAMRMDFDFGDGGGFAVARKEFKRQLPESFAFSFRIRGEAPPNIFEFKLADPGGRNVWRYREESMAFTGQWTTIRLPSGRIPFAWGPAGGGPIKRLGAIEFVIAAGTGGRGTVWIEDLRLEDPAQGSATRATASSEATGHKAIFALRKSGARGWRPKSSDPLPFLQLDFGREREFGGLVIDWGTARAPRSFDVKSSATGLEWSTLASIRGSRAEKSFVRLPGGWSRFLRIAFRKGGPTPMIRHIAVQPHHFGSSEMDFLHNVAALGPRGRFPKYLYRKQSYWTCVGIPDGTTRALINQQGLVEPNEASFSLEPFLYANGQLMTWADARISQELADDSLPIPSSLWRMRGLTMRVTAAAHGKADSATVFVRYRLRNEGRRRSRICLFVALRPFQVTPPWQAWKHFGGISHISDITWRGGAAWVNRSTPVIPLSPPSAFGAQAFDQGNITDYLARGKLPEAKTIRDPLKLASGAFRFDVALAPGCESEILMAVPLGRDLSLKPTAPRQIMQRYRKADPIALATREWASVLDAVQFQFPRSLAAMANTCRTAIAQILINRDGPAIQPGPRRYTRSWIRDGAIMSAALLRTGHDREVRDFIEWYASFQRADGFVPCCVDRWGPDWLVEHDSHGQLIYAAAEYLRFTRDRAFIESIWPAILKATRIIASLRSQRLGPGFDSPKNAARKGLLPESASHEGYLAHPVHSYWDDFWAIRGLKDAAQIARLLGHDDQARDIEAECLALRSSVRSSIDATIASKKINHIPGSVELGDFDPTSTAIAIALLGGSHELPAKPLAAMFETFVKDLRKRRSGQIDWNNYTAYEIRIIGALVRLGKRADATELLRFFLADRRPLPWNQWPEISWRDQNAPGHIGDIPHAWIGAEYVLSLCSLFAFESESDDSLVIGAGIDPTWAKSANGFSIRGLRTWHGPLDLAMSSDRKGRIVVQIGGDIRMPPGGIVFHAPLTRPPKTANVNGKPAEIRPDGKTLLVREFPAEISLSAARA